MDMVKGVVHKATNFVTVATLAIQSGKTMAARTELKIIGGQV